MNTNLFHRMAIACSRKRRPETEQPTSSESGLTLIECIMAIVVIGLTGAAIAPMMLVSVATRVQSQKAEQAMELAQSEVDQVRVLFERGIDSSADLPPVVAANTNASAIGGPTSLADIQAGNIIDINRDGTLDFAVQSYLVEKTGIAGAYEMGVRVYDYRTVESNAGGALNTDRASVGMTSTQGERTEKPLAVLYTNVALTEESDSLCRFIDYTNQSGTPDKPPACS